MRSSIPLMAVLALTMTACIDDFEQAALTWTREGNLQIVYVPCPGDVATSVRLTRDVNDSSTDLWRIVLREGAQPSGNQTFEPGRTAPTGYRETLPLEEIEPGTSVVAYLQQQGGGSFARGFEWGTRVEPGRYLTADGMKASLDEYLDYAGCKA